MNWGTLKLCLDQIGGGGGAREGIGNKNKGNTETFWMKHRQYNSFDTVFFSHTPCRNQEKKGLSSNLSIYLPKLLTGYSRGSSFLELYAGMSRWLQMSATYPGNCWFQKNSASYRLSASSQPLQQTQEQQRTLNKTDEGKVFLFL